MYPTGLLQYLGTGPQRLTRQVSKIQNFTKSFEKSLNFAFSCMSNSHFLLLSSLLQHIKLKICHFLPFSVHNSISSHNIAVKEQHQSNIHLFFSKLILWNEAVFSHDLSNDLEIKHIYICLNKLCINNAYLKPNYKISIKLIKVL